MLEDVLTCLYAPLLLVIIQQFWQYLCTDLSCVQIFCDNLTVYDTVDAQLTFDHTNS